MSSLRLLLVRHGQTESNIHHRLDSRPPGPPLTELGQQQAAALAQRLAGQPVGAVYSSVAVRAIQTAAPIAGCHGLPVRATVGLHEVFCGDYEYSNEPAHVEEFIDISRSWHAGDLDRPVPGGECARQLLGRFLPVVAGIRAEHPDGVVVLVSHSAALRLVGHTLAGTASTALASAYYLRNCSVITLEADGAGWRCLDWAGTPVPG